MKDPMQELQEKLKVKLGIANSLAAHAKSEATRIQQAAAHHHDDAHYHLQQMGGRLQAAGIGNDPEAEESYCHALMDRHRMGQAYELAGEQAQRFPDVEPMRKSLRRLAPGAHHLEYRPGLLQALGAGEPDDYLPRYYDPRELLPREAERDKDPGKVEYFRRQFTEGDPDTIDPLVLVRTEQGREILDGHHRWLGAKEAGEHLKGVEVSEDGYNHLKGAGFADSDIAYAVLAHGGCWDAAESVTSQYDGKPVRATGYLAYEHLLNKDLGEMDG